MGQNEASPPVHVLSFQAEYVCRHSTNCCTAPWGIALDDSRADHVAREIDTGGLSVPRATDGNWLTPPGGSRSPGAVHVLRRDDTGACVFLDRQGGRCAIHRACGHETLPEACQQFPRVTLLDDRGIHVTLSHYCPTVTTLALAEPVTPVSIVSPPAGFARAPLVAGLDARGHWPPLLRPGVMCSSGTWSTWEAWVVDELANGMASPWTTLGGLARAADEVRAWRSTDGDQQDFVRRVLENRSGHHSSTWAEFDPVACWETTWSAVPEDRATRPSLDAGAPAWQGAVDAAFAEVERHRRTVGRYLAARAFASWCAYQGGGVRTHIASVRTALGVLVVELARVYLLRRSDLESGPEASLPPLARALPQADWLLVHLAESDALARTWAKAELVRAG